MADTLISVIVPVYNVEKYLTKCVESLVAQKFSEPYEIVLVDDGAKDSSGKMCDEFAEKYEIVKAHHKKNGGLSDARNYGTAHSEGKLLTYVDSDDYVSETYLQDLWNLLTKFDADMAITNVVLRYEGVESSNNNTFEDFCVNAKDAFYEVYAGNHISWPVCGKLYKREVLTNDIFPAGYYEDTACMYKIIEKCERVAIGDYNNNYHYVRREGSITFAEYQDRHLRIFEVCDELAEYIDQTYPDYHFIAIKLYQNGVELLLNRLNIKPEVYNEIFYRYQKLFRENLKDMLGNRKIGFKYKVYYVLLCTKPGIYKAFTGTLHNIRNIRSRKEKSKHV